MLHLGGDYRVVDAVLYGDHYTNGLDELTRANQSWAQSAAPEQRDFLQGSFLRVNDYYTSEEAREAVAAANKIRGRFNVDDISLLDNLESLQQARPVMVDYLMSNPELALLADKGVIDGYSDDYEAPELQVGQVSNEFAQVYSGISTPWSDGTSFYTDQDDLSPEEQNDIILSTHMAMYELHENGNDATSPFNHKAHIKKKADYREELLTSRSPLALIRKLISEG